MVTIIKVIHRIGLRNGNYIHEISDNQEKLIFESRHMAKNAQRSMAKSKSGKVIWDNDKIVIRNNLKMSESAIVEVVKKDLDYMISNRVAFQKIKYELV